MPIRPVPGRRSRILQGGYDPVTNMSIAVVSTIVVAALFGLAIVNSPGWATVKTAFFNVGEGRDAFPLVARAFLLNVKMFMVAEVLILAFALVIAVMRGVPGPVFFPLRAFAVAYTDFFRGVPTILVFLAALRQHKTAEGGQAREDEVPEDTERAGPEHPGEASG